MPQDSILKCRWPWIGPWLAPPLPLQHKLLGRNRRLDPEQLGKVLKKLFDKKERFRRGAPFYFLYLFIYRHPSQLQSICRGEKKTPAQTVREDLHMWGEDTQRERERRLPRAERERPKDRSLVGCPVVLKKGVSLWEWGSTLKFKWLTLSRLHYNSTFKSIKVKLTVSWP